MFATPLLLTFEVQDWNNFLIRNFQHISKRKKCNKALNIFCTTQLHSITFCGFLDRIYLQRGLIASCFWTDRPPATILTFPKTLRNHPECLGCCLCFCNNVTWFGSISFVLHPRANPPLNLASTESVPLGCVPIH